MLTITGDITERRIENLNKATITDPNAGKDEVEVITKKRSKRSKKDKYRNLMFLGGLNSQGSTGEIGANKFHTNTQDLAAYSTPQNNSNVETKNFPEPSSGVDGRNLDISDKRR